MDRSFLHIYTIMVLPTANDGYDKREEACIYETTVAQEY